MIEFNILETQEPNKRGNFQFHMDAITIGGDIKNNCFLPFDQILDEHITLQVTQNQLIAIAHEEVDHYHVNGKKTKGKKRLKVHDLITLGTAKLEIKTFSSEPDFAKNIFFNQRVDELNEQNSPLLNVLKNMGDHEE